MSAQLRVVRPALTPVRVETSVATVLPGREPAACLDLALADWAPGQAVTLGHVQWPGATPAQALDDAVQAIDALALRRASAMLSLDPAAFDHDSSRLVRVAAQAQHMGVGFQFDWLGSASGPEDMDATRRAVLAVRAACLSMPTTTLVGRWLRSRDDADWACAQQVPLRIVKGHRPDPLRPLHDANAGFLALVQRVAGRACSVTLATNDPSLAHDALVKLLRAGTPCELELMHGAARSPALQVARRLGVPVRCFVPWGATRRLLSVSPGARDPREAGWAREAPPRALRLLSHP